ncbi:MFS transporter [Halobacteriales archaeon QS_1_68_20]|nr:MAG: MFS transporter [Halobacteriales archaeon QS_1_68_20]
MKGVPDLSSLWSNRPFVRLFLGRLITNAGDSMYSIATMWLVSSMTGSAMYTGAAGFLVRIPTTFRFLVGPLVDRWSLRRVLVGTQLVQGILVLIIPLAAVTGNLTVWIVLGIMPVLTLVNQFFYPAQTATLPRILDDDELVRANMLFSVSLEGSNMLFNAATGVLIGIVGTVNVFLFDSITFAVAAALFVGITIQQTPGMNSGEGDGSTAERDDQSTAGPEVADGGEPSEEDHAEESGYVESLREGIDYIRGSAVTAMLMGAVLLNFAFGTGIAVFPRFADSIGGPELYGVLMGAVAGGGLVGALAAGYVEDVPYGWFTIASKLASAGALILAVAVPSIPIKVLMFFLGFVPLGMGTVMNGSMYQSAVDDDLMARVTSLTESISTAMLPVGSLIGGVVAEFVGVVPMLYMVGVAFALYGLYFYLRPSLRTLPPVAEADAEALGLG